MYRVIISPPVYGAFPLDYSTENGELARQVFLHCHTFSGETVTLLFNGRVLDTRQGGKGGIYLLQEGLKHV